MKNKIFISVVYTAAAVLLLAGPHTLFKVCELTEPPMKCWWTVRAETGTAVLLFVSAGLYVFSSTTREKIYTSIFAAADTIFVILLPFVLIGGCSMNTMPCRTVTFPAIYAIGIITLIVTAGNLIVLIMKSGREHLH